MIKNITLHLGTYVNLYRVNHQKYRVTHIILKFFNIIKFKILENKKK